MVTAEAPGLLFVNSEVFMVTSESNTRGTENFFNVDTGLVTLVCLAIGFLNALPDNAERSVFVTFFKDIDFISLQVPSVFLSGAVDLSEASFGPALLVLEETAAFSGLGATNRGRLNAPLPATSVPSFLLTRFLYIVSENRWPRRLSTL